MKKLLLILILIPSILFCQDISDLQNKRLNDLNDKLYAQRKYYVNQISYYKKTGRK